MKTPKSSPTPKLLWIVLVILLAIPAYIAWQQCKEEPERPPTHKSQQTGPVNVTGNLDISFSK